MPKAEIIDGDVVEELREHATEILAYDEWFRRLPAANKDSLSQPNHDAIQAEAAVALARKVLDAIGGP